MIKLKLKRVSLGDFRRSEATLYEALPVAERKLRGEEAILFVSGVGNQMAFVWAPVKAIGQTGRETVIIRSAKLRLTSGTWSPLMLENYANALGLELDGFKRLEKQFAHLRDDPDEAEAA